MILLLLAAITVVLAALGAVYTALGLPVDEPPGRLHHTATCSCPREPEGAYA